MSEQMNAGPIPTAHRSAQTLKRQKRMLKKDTCGASRSVQNLQFTQAFNTSIVIVMCPPNILYYILLGLIPISIANSNHWLSRSLLPNPHFFLFVL